MKEAVKIKMRAFRKWMKLRTPDTRRDYITARTEAERINRAENRNVWRKIGDNLREDHAGTRKLLYSMAKNYRAEKKDTACTIKDKEGNIITEPERVMERWKEYFKELLNVEEEEIGGPVEYFQGIDTEEIYENITAEEVRAAIQQMKSGKAVGVDGIPVELLEAAGPPAVEAIQKLCDEAYRTEKIPEEWQQGVICPIYKKGNSLVCGNHRGITLLPHTAKVYSRILEKRVRSRV